MRDNVTTWQEVISLQCDERRALPEYPQIVVLLRSVPSHRSQARTAHCIHIWMGIGCTIIAAGCAYIVEQMLRALPLRSDGNHLIEEEVLRFKELEHVLIEKFAQVFRNML